jgi:uncharacterized protein
MRANADLNVSPGPREDRDVPAPSPSAGTTESRAAKANAADWPTATVALLLVGSVGLVLLRPRLPDSGGLIGQILDTTTYVVLLAATLYFLCIRPRKPLGSVIPRGERSLAALFVFAVLAFVASTAFAVPAVFLTEWIFREVLGRPIIEPDSADLGGSGPEQALRLLTTIFLAPLHEEVLSRGVVYRWLRGRRGQVFAIAASSILFSALHLDLQGFLQHAAWGATMAYFVGRTGSLYPAIAVHMSMNALAIVL